MDRTLDAHEVVTAATVIAVVPCGHFIMEPPLVHSRLLQWISESQLPQGPQHSLTQSTANHTYQLSGLTDSHLRQIVPPSPPLKAFLVYLFEAGFR